MSAEIRMTSLDIAEITGKEHKNIMRDIRKEIEELGEEVGRLIFEQSVYLNSQNKEQPCYIFGKKGAMQLALKYDAETRYKVIGRIEELEKRIQHPPVLTERQAIIQSLKLTAELAEEQEEIKRDVSMLKNTMRIDGAEEFQIKQKATRRVVESLGGKDAPAYQELNRKVFSRFWNEFKRHFLIPRYGDLPKSRFKEGLEFIEEWQPDTSTRIEINELNRQMTIKEVS